MNRIIVGYVLFTGLSLARAADPEPLELGALLAEAEAAHPSVLAQSERAAAAGERAEAAGALPDPRLSVSYTNDSLSELTLGESQFSSVTVRWDQEVPRKSARQLDAEVARRESGSALAAQQALRARLRARVVEAYAAIWRADRLRALFLESREVLGTAREAARARYETGEGGQQAVLRAQTEVRRVDVELEGLARERRAAEIALAETLGRRDDPHFGPAGELPTVELGDPASLEADAIASGPETLVARAETDRAHAAVERARAEAKPEWGWMAAYQYLGSLDPMVMGGVTVRLPLWSNSKQARTIAQGEREAAAAQREREASELVSLARVRELSSEIDSIERQRALLEEALIPEGIASLDAARAAFSAGRAEMTLVLDDHSRLLADRRTAVDLAARRVVLAASLEAVTGARIVAGGAR